MENLSFFIQREQTERALAAQAASESVRQAHLELADSYAKVIDAYRRLSGLRGDRDEAVA